MAYIFDGKKFAQEKEAELKKRVDALKEKDIVPRLEAFLVGNNPASEIYVAMKAKAAERLGVILHLNKLLENEKDDLIQLIEVMNNDPKVHGIMIQLPLPEPLRSFESEIINNIFEEKDVDGLRSEPTFLPATVKAVLYAIKAAQKNKFLSQDFSQIQTVVVGSSGMVGKPLSNEIERLGVNVIRCDDKTQDLQGETLQCDLLISATGVPGLITKGMVKSGAVVIDVGAPSGDVAETVREAASFITPVPGGIGPMTVVFLMENVIEAAERRTR